MPEVMMPDTAVKNFTGEMHTFGAEMAGLQQRVSGLEQGMSQVILSIKDLSVKFDSRGATPWGQIWTALGVGVAAISIIGGLVWSPIKTDMERVERVAASLAISVVPRAEHERIWGETRRELDRVNTRLDHLEFPKEQHGG